MKFLVDAQLPPGLCAWLEERGHLANHVQDRGDEPPTDLQIAAFVEAEQSVLISKDEDFVTLRLPDRRLPLAEMRQRQQSRAQREWLGGHWPSVERLESGGRLITLR